MFILIGLIAVFLIVLYKRSTEIITINPLHGVRRDVQESAEEDAPQDGSDSLDFARLISTVQQAAEQASQRRSSGGAKLPSSDKGRAAVMTLVGNNQFMEAMQLYRRLYGVDLAAAKKAVDQMMLRQGE